jgi:hypothetical protein
MSGRWQSWTTTTATSILAIRTHLFPAWLGWIGLILGAAHQPAPPAPRDLTAPRGAGYVSDESGLQSISSG